MSAKRRQAHKPRFCHASGGVAISIALLVALVLSVSSASAESLSPWWSVTAGSRPTNLHAGAGENEVQEVTWSEGGAFELKINQTTIGYFEAAPYNFGGLFGLQPATEEKIQKALESTSAYGAGNVTVKGGPAGTAPLEITSINEDADRPVPPVEVAPFFGEGTGEAKVVTKGRSDGEIVVMVDNVGDTNANGENTPFTIVDKLPAKLRAVSIEGNAPPNGGPLQCSKEPASEPLSCTFAKRLAPYHDMEVVIGVMVEPEALSGEENKVSVSGGGVAVRTLSRPITVGDKTSFGVENYQLIPEEPGGSVDTRAGSHPFQLTSIVAFNQTANGEPAAFPKDLYFKLPPGMVGDPAAIPQCTDAQFSTVRRDVTCPPQSVIGATTVVARVAVNHVTALYTFTSPLYNLIPLNGEPARFGFVVNEAWPVVLDTHVRTGEDYGVTVTSDDITQIAALVNTTVTFWGVPGDLRHDGQRGRNCLTEAAGECNPLGEVEPLPFLTLPTSCDEPFVTTVTGDSWPATIDGPSQTIPTQPSEPPPTYTLPGERLTGCNHLPFAPEISVAPDVSDASTPAGLEVKVHVPQTAALDANGLAEASIKDTTVALPEGLTLNPGGADGLEACSEAQIGFQGHEEESGAAATNVFTPTLPKPLEPGVNFCPDASKIGTVEIETPLLPHALKGAVYLASPAPNGEAGQNPFRSLIAMYIVAEDPVSGSLVKLPGKVVPDPSTGRLTTTFKNTPQLPFENLRLHFFGGSRAPLGTPALCGAYTTKAAFTPWSGNEPVNTSSTFNITSGPNGAPCPNSPGVMDPKTLPFAPSLAAGTTSIQAGGFSPLTTTISREDGNQDLQGVTLHMPPGLSGIVASVEQCGEAQADAGTCGPGSLIGHTIVSVGLGGNPYSVTGGQVFLTGPYAGAPYGLSIVNPANAGPFHLGNVIVRAKIEVDSTTGAITVTTDPSGPHAIPPILDGIPLQIKHVNVTVDRPGFTFNPTDCNRLGIGASLTSDQGASSSLSVPFQVTNCATLGFKPKFKVSTSAKTSRTNGASLDVKLTYPKAPFGSQANIAKVKVNLPKELPSRLTTLQKACPDSVFNQNPAACPKGSKVGGATATTPILAGVLSGPAYFVSHGGAKFPELIIVLQGGGVTVDLHGETFISSKGITSSTYRSVPDLPIGTFELKLPEGPNSALAANANLCAVKLAMPTAFTAQNGMEIHQSTPIGVTGCKAAISVLRHSVSGATASIVVKTPSAGRLTASGNGLSSVSRKLGKAGTVTLDLTLSSAEQRFLSGHPGRRLQVGVKLLFTPVHGKRLSTSVTVLMG